MFLTQEILGLENNWTKKYITEAIETKTKVEFKIILKEKEMIKHIQKWKKRKRAQC